MEKQPKFLRKFSKEKSPSGRQETAKVVKAKRKEYFDQKNTRTERQIKLQQILTRGEQAMQEQLQTIQSLREQIVELSDHTFGKVLSYLKFRKIRADIVRGQKIYDKLKIEQNTNITEQDAIAEGLNTEKVPEALSQSRNILDDFYSKQRKKWTNCEFTKEDIIENFSEEHLSSLSVEDYALLLQRFPSEMVTHVTRQGIRDHIGHMEHLKGRGEYADGFLKIVEDGRLRSPLGVYLIENEKERVIAEFLHLKHFKTKEDALGYLEQIVADRQGGQGSYVDRMAIHFATEEVADGYYGSEKGNEIFIAYPSAHVASQYYFNGQLNQSGGGYWNDQWIWANEERGMDINAGLVFLPEEARVDRQTGSRYQIDENGNPVKNAEYQAAFRRLIDAPDFHEFADQVIKISGKLSQHWNDANLLLKNQEVLKKLEPFRQRLEQEFGIVDRRLQMSILYYHTMSDLDLYLKNKKEGIDNSFSSVDSVIDRALGEEGILFKEPEETIGSKEFWDTYFARDGVKRPSKVVYYKGLSPTKALLDWQRNNGIIKKSKSDDMGFPERKVERDTPEAKTGLDRFRILAEKVIDDHFSINKPSL